MRIGVSPFSPWEKGPGMRACAHDDDLLNGLGTEPRAVATGIATHLTIEYLRMKARRVVESFFIPVATALGSVPRTCESQSDLGGQ